MTLFGSRRPPPARPVIRAGLAAALGAGLLAACSGPAATGPRAAGSASRLPSAGAPHGAPTVIPPTTPAAGSAAPGGGPTSPAPLPAPVPPTTAPPASAPPTAAPPTTGPPTTGPAACTTSGLRVSLGAANGAAGSIYYPLVFRNVSGAACSLFGYPGVSFVAAPGRGQLGGPAARNTTFRPSLVTLAPGAAAHASVQVVVAQSYPASLCKPVTVHWLRVYPPGQFTPLYARVTATTCTGAIPGGSTLGIYVVRPGANGP
jgi:hypothetical protein